MLLLWSSFVTLQVFAQAGGKGTPFVRLKADDAKVNARTTEIVGDSLRWLALKAGAAEKKDSTNMPPDAVFEVRAPHAGTFEMSTYAIGRTLPEGVKTPTSFIWIQIDHGRPTKRIVLDTYYGSSQVAGRFELNGKKQQVKIWLPEGIRLGEVSWKEYVPPAVPEAARNYVPNIVPPAGRPRLWVNAESLPVVKARLHAGENEAAWEKVKQAALLPYPFNFQPDREMFYDEALEKAAQTKAFYYLMTGDRKTGMEAVRLATDYLSVLEFGNVKYGDITREVGRAIYTGALVYDWCYNLLDVKDKRSLRKNMMRLAEDMEIGWPPFDNSAINGHGNEAQVSRDLLAMSMAIYDEDPLPYRYTSYIILEQLVPMRRFEYQSPRHNQGVDYGAYRFGWEMHAAWLFYRMTGRPVFDDNIKNLPEYWLYMRRPDGLMLPDGDMFNVKSPQYPYYWKQPQTMLLCYAYSGNPLIKGEFEREGGLPDNPVLFLLVNDPALKGEKSVASLPLTKDFGPVLGSMVARTGWNNTPVSNDVIAEIKGGGYNFGNHQHADAGALQIYYHGIQVGDIGLYLSYGPPYDFNFNKRSISHSVMLARDPGEKLLFRTEANDGGSRFSQRFPVTPAEVTTDPWFNYGRVLSADFGPSKQTPVFSYFKADLTAAYTSKLSSYSRAFCFLNLGREDVPAAIILADDMITSDPAFKKYWQINTLKEPVRTPAGFILRNEQNGIAGKTYVEMLVPSAADCEATILSGEKANSTFEFQYKVNSNKPEASAHRIMVSPATPEKRDRFLTVFQMTADKVNPLPVKFYETGPCYIVIIGNRVVGMSSATAAIETGFTFNIPETQEKEYEVILTGLAPGIWHVQENNQDFRVDERKNTLYFKAAAGKYTVRITK